MGFVRRYLSLLLAMCMLLSSVPLVALAEELTAVTDSVVSDETAEAHPEQVETLIMESEPEEPEATVEPTAEATPEATAEPTAEATPEPTVEPTAEVTPEATAEPTAEPMPEATAEPAPEATMEVTEEAIPDETVEPAFDDTEDMAQDADENAVPVPEGYTWKEEADEVFVCVTEDTAIYSADLSMELDLVGAGTLLQPRGYLLRDDSIEYICIDTMNGIGLVEWKKVVVADEGGEDQQVYNNWVYYLNTDGFITIVDYVDKSVEKLVIPETIDGTYVAEIRGSFSELKNLKSVRIGANISTIVREAFKNADDLCVHAYFGTTAYAFAKETGCNIKCLSQFEFANGVVDLAGMNSDAYSYRGDHDILIVKPYALQLSVGKIVNMPVAAQLGDAFVHKIESIEQHLDYVLIHTSKPTVEESYVRIQLDFNNQQMYFVDEDAQEQNARKNYGFSASLKKNFSVPISKALTFLDSSSELTIKNVKLNGSINYVVPLSSKNSFKATLNYDVDSKLVLKKSFSKPILLGTAWLYDPLGIIKVEMNVYLNVGANGKIEITLKNSFSHSMEVQSKKKSCTNKVTQKDFFLEASGKVSVGLQAELVVSLIGIVDIGNVSIGVDLIARGSINSNRCLDASLNLEIWWSGKILLWGISHEVLDEKNLGSIHIEDGWKVNNCTRQDKTVTFNTNGGSRVNSQTVKWNRTISKPANPTKSGATFVGWYCDAALTRQWNFSTPVTYNMTLYAKWSTNQSSSGGGSSGGGESSGTLEIVDVRHPDVYMYNNYGYGFVLSDGIVRSNVNLVRVTTDIQNPSGKSITSSLPKTVYPSGKSYYVIDLNKDLPFSKINSAGTFTWIITAEDSAGRVVTLRMPFESIPSGAERWSHSSAYYQEPSNPTISVTGISVDRSSLSLQTGNSATLSATVYPNNATNRNVSWSSSNHSVATVSGGKVTAVGAGTTTITAKTADGGFSASCKVSVSNPTVKVSSVMLSNNRVTLNNGNGIELSATVYPSNATNKGVYWTSTNNSVATVSSGWVKAVGVGEARIFCTAVDGSNVYDVCDVTVIASNVKPSSVSICEGSKLSIPKGSGVQLTADVSPSYASTALTWTSSDTKVAKVNKTSGMVTAVKKGTATITVKTSNGKKDSIAITVYDPNYVSSVELNYSGTVEMGLNENLWLYALVTPATASTKLSWKSSKKSVASVSADGIVTAKKPGTATITVESGNGKKDSVKIKVVDRSLPTKIEINKSGTVKLNLNQMLILRATITPTTAAGATYKWSSSDKKIATVDKWGIVTPHKKGTVTITVKTDNGKKDTVKIKVEG